MCGIVGYIGRKNATPILIDGLRRESYRGYDSSGLVVLGEGEPVCFKAVGKLENLENKIANQDLQGNLALGHVRWATHGGVTEANAHPHSCCKKNIWLVHNGIIENYVELKERLVQEGHQFNSETDTEVAAHLIEKYFQGNLEEAVRKAIKEVRGTYGLAVIAKDDPWKIVAARLSSPLVIGVSESEYIIASDPAAIISHTNKVIHLEDNEIAVMTPDNFFILKEKQPEAIDLKAEEISKGDYPHFMLKEIMEGPQAVENSVRGRLLPEEGLAKLGGLESVAKDLQQVKRLNIVACGTAFHAGLIGKYMLEEYAGIPVEVDLASEFRYRKPILDETSPLFCISQSGETADTLAALREVKRKGILTLGIVNAVGSSLVRETDAGVYNHVGPEIGVASTKAFISQVTVLTLLTLFLGRQRNLSLIKGKRIIEDIQKLPEQIKSILAKEKEIKELAGKYSKFNNFLYLGRKYNYPIALEGALKLKELAYPVHAEGYASGEMKHGPLALADENFPFIFIVPQDSVYEKNLSNMQEIKARKAPMIAIATEGDEKTKEIADDLLYIPHTSEMLAPILSVVPLQLFAYYMSLLRGNDPDKPRNLAKSVTVE